jgi:1-deoxy-D-xylulose-5-phosphate synthase
MNDRYPLIASLASPSDIRKMAPTQLAELAGEVRQAILHEVSKTGGHFASNLGTVELTVALYATYDLEHDKVVWDTGHQAYPHKLLTGRLDRFDTLRKHHGLGGFLRRTESPYDAFGAGHAGTAISAALGFALARDRLGTDERIAAVTGDAAIASGMSWEALNHAGELGTRIAVVLNDNRMSIAPNVGALTNYLARLRSRPLLQTLARRAKDVVEKIPGPFPRVAAGFRHGITHYLAPESTGTIFEEIGLEYIGPVDGHDIPTLIEVFQNVRELDLPVFVHAITVKGKGYEPGEEDARKWHAVVPFDLSEQEMPIKVGPVTYTQAFGSAAVACAEQDEKVVAITAAMPDGTGLNAFAAKFPERFYDVGIAEQHGVTLAAGMAAGGLKPFCAIYSTFLQRAFDQVLHDVAIQNLPVRFFMDRAGLVGDDGATHHGAFDISFLSCIPNMVLLAPRDTTELVEMTHWMAGFDDHPSAVRYPRGAGSDRLPEARTAIHLGRAEWLSRGMDLTLIGVGSMVSSAFDAAAILAEKGLDVGVLNPRFIKPLDVDAILEAAEQSAGIVVIEENVSRGGFGEAVRALLADRGTPFRTLALPDEFVEHGPQPVLREEAGIGVEAIVAAALQLRGESIGPRR